MTCSHRLLTTSRSRVAWLVATAALITLTGVSGTAQSQGQGRGRALFAEQAGPQQAAAADSSDPTTRRGRRVRANVAALHDTSTAEAGDITLNLFDDVQLRARRTRLDVTPRGGSVWHGRLLDIHGDATIAVNDGVMAGTIVAGETAYEILYAGNGEHFVREIEPSAFPTDDPHVDLPVPEPDPQGEAFDSGGAAVAADSASQIDVIVVWTPNARSAAGGAPAMQSLVDLSVANTNTAYANSNVTQRIRLVYSGEVSYTESGISTDLGRLQSQSDGHMDTVHSLRTTYGADVVTLIGNGYTSAGACGVGYLMSSVSSGFANSAFNVVDRTCSAGNHSFAHELGHNMGLQHDPGNAGSSPAYSYAYGYQDPGNAFRTVMSYGGATRVMHFSNPSVTYGGKVTGTSTQNNALALNNTAYTVANFRQATSGGGGCTYALGSSSTSVGSGSATSSVSVVAGSGCTWTAASNASWLTITSGSSGTSNGTVGYSVAANTAGTSRTGTLTVAGKTFTVTQAAAACAAFTLSSTSTSVVAAGGAVNVTVTGTTGCARTATSNASWITVTAGATGTGSGTVSLSVAANTGATSRTGTVTIAGVTYTVTQAAASCAAFTLSSTSTSVAATGGAVNVTVTGTTGCARTATSNASWITVTAGATGTGSGTVSLSVAANTAGTSRTGTVTIAGVTYTVTQSAASCAAFTLSSTSASVAAAGGAVNVTVTGTTGCARTVTSNASWITVTAGATGTGSGTVSLSVAANLAGTSRVGTVTIAGVTFAVTQAAVTCSYAISPGSTTVTSAGGSGSFTLTAPSGCASTASSSASWLTITSGATGTGTRTIGYSVASNSGNARTASILVGGQTFAVSQAKKSGPSRNSAKADFNGDSMADLLWQHTDGSVAVWMMSGTSALSTEFLNPGRVDPAWRMVGSGDLDGDGKPEVVWQHQTGWLLAWFMSGNAVSHSAFLTPGQVETSWKIAAIGDMNADGRDDLIWQHDQGALGVWYMNGTSMVSSALLNPSSSGGSDWQIVGVGDLNGDQKPDLVWQQSSGGVVGAWLMDGLNATSFVLMNPSQVDPTVWKLRSVIDIDGDGMTDLLWQSSGGGLFAWLMDGTTAKTTKALNPGGVGSGWRLVGPR